MIVGYENLAGNVNKVFEYESPFLYEKKDFLEKHSGISMTERHVWVSFKEKGIYKLLMLNLQLRTNNIGSAVIFG